MRTHIDLFSGIGGFALAARWANVQTVGFAEIDSYASRVLAKNFPEVTNYGDIDNVPAIDNVWLITGGFPCQPFSLAGKRAGSSDDRWLWPKMAGVIDRIRPYWVLAENVPGIIGMELDTVLSDLESIGYSTQAIAIPAVGVDAPHRRERIWIVGNSSCCGQQRIDGGGAREKFENGCQIVSDTNQGNCRWRTDEQEREAQERTAFNWNSENVADADCARLEGRDEYRRDARQWPLGQGGRAYPAIWEPEPNVGRVANGISNRVDRLKGLGNAIVPQVGFQIIRMMIAVDELS